MTWASATLGWIGLCLIVAPIACRFFAVCKTGDDAEAGDGERVAESDQSKSHEGCDAA